MRKFKKRLIVACRVFEKELTTLLSPVDELLFLEFGYHKRPDLLQKKLQHIIDSAEGFDVILLLYGYCGGTLHLKAGNIPVIIPKANDCFDIMLGTEVRMQIFSEEPGTYFLSEGWIRQDGTPYEKIKRFRKAAEKRGINLISEFYNGYKRLFLVNTGVLSKESRSRVQNSALRLYWKFEEKRVGIQNIQRLINGEQEEGCMVLNPCGMSFSLKEYNARDNKTFDQSLQQGS